MKECGNCYDPGTNIVCRCIRVVHIFEQANRLLDELFHSLFFIFWLGFAVGVFFCIWLSSFMRSWYDEGKKKNDG